MDDPDRLATLLKQNEKKAEAMRLLRKRRREEQLKAAGKALPDKPKRKPRPPKTFAMSPESNLPEMSVTVQPKSPTPKIHFEQSYEIDIPPPSPEVFSTFVEEVVEDSTPVPSEIEVDIIEEESEETHLLNLLDAINETLWNVAPHHQINVATRCLEYLRQITAEEEVLQDEHEDS